MRSSSPLLSYQQVLATRQCPLSEREVIVLLTQLLTEVAKLHAGGRIHGNLSLEQLWRDVDGELYMHPAAQARSGWTARDDVRSIAQMAIILLSNHVFHPDWQSYSQIRQPLAEVLAAALNFTVTLPIRDAADLLSALHLVHLPQPVPIPPVVLPADLQSTAPMSRSSTSRSSTSRSASLQRQAKRQIRSGLNFVVHLCLQWFRKILLIAAVLLCLGVAGWLAYEHFMTFVPDRPVVNSQISPSPAPGQSLKPSPSPAPKPSPESTERPPIVLPEEP